MRTEKCANIPGLGPVFRARHGSRLHVVCMSLTLNGDVNVNVKPDTGTIILRKNAATPIGSGLISLVCRVRAPNLTLAT